MATGLDRGLGPATRVAVAPLVGDLVVVPAAILLVGSMADGVLRGLSIAGAVFLAYLGVDTIRRANRTDQAADGPPGSDLWRGVVVNVLNPHPWLFWFTVGGPLAIGAWVDEPAQAVAFLVGFYSLLIGSKVVLAAVAARSRRLVNGAWHRRLIVASGVVLLIVAASIMLRPPV